MTFDQIINPPQKLKTFNKIVKITNPKWINVVTQYTNNGRIYIYT